MKFAKKNRKVIKINDFLRKCNTSVSYVIHEFLRGLHFLLVVTKKIQIKTHKCKFISISLFFGNLSESSISTPVSQNLNLMSIISWFSL